MAGRFFGALCGGRRAGPAGPRGRRAKRASTRRRRTSRQVRRPARPLQELRAGRHGARLRPRLDVRPHVLARPGRLLQRQDAHHPRGPARPRPERQADGRLHAGPVRQGHPCRAAGRRREEGHPGRPQHGHAGDPAVLPAVPGRDAGAGHRGRRPAQSVPGPGGGAGQVEGSGQRRVPGRDREGHRRHVRADDDARRSASS